MISPSSKLLRAAIFFTDAAKFEEEQEPNRWDPRSEGQSLVPCEACGHPLKSGGLCPSCLKMVATTLHGAGMRLAKGGKL